MTQDIGRFLDEEGKLKQLPKKHALQELVFAYLAEKFEYGKEYSEQEVNAILAAWHTFGDYFVLRRGLVDCGFLSRLPNGSKYWLNEEKRAQEEENGHMDQNY